MKRICVLLSTIVLTTGIYGQTGQIILPLTIQDSTGAMDMVLFGYDPEATRCIDDSLGESEIPYDACCNWFNLLCIRFSDISLYDPPGACLGNGVRLDLRSFQDSNQVDTFRIDFCGSPPFVLRWPSSLEETLDNARLVDQFGGLFYDIDMLTTDSLIITNGSIKALMMYTYGPDMMTGITTEPSGFPEHYSLSQNYPNPFNATTTISYALSHTSQVSLKVFDLLGRGVGILVDAIQQPGAKSVRFEAGGLGSGLYLYRLRVDGSQQIRKLLVQK